MDPKTSTTTSPATVTTTPEPFETETMAELHARQGRPGEALTIFQRLTETHPHHPACPRWNARIAELQAQLQALLAEAGDTPMLPDEVAIPETPGVTTAAGRNQWGRTEAVVAWALPATPTPPALEVLLVLRSPEGVETVHKSLSLQASRGRLSIPAENLYAVAAAAGFYEAEGRFVPVARSRQT